MTKTADLRIRLEPSDLVRITERAKQLHVPVVTHVRSVLLRDCDANQPLAPFDTRLHTAMLRINEYLASDAGRNVQADDAGIRDMMRAAGMGG